MKKMEHRTNGSFLNFIMQRYHQPHVEAIVKEALDFRLSLWKPLGSNAIVDSPKVKTSLILLPHYPIDNRSPQP